MNRIIQDSAEKPGSSLAARGYQTKSNSVIPVITEPMQVPTTINELEDNGQLFESNKSPYINRKSLPLESSSSMQNQGSASKLIAAQHNQAILTQDQSK